MPKADLTKTFISIYETESDAIFRFCLMRVSDREQTLDLVQETFTRLWMTISSGKEMSNVRAFLFTVARNLIIDWYRKKKGLPMGSLADGETGEAFDPPDESAEKALREGSEGRFLLESIAKISSTNRQAVYLRFVEGLTPPEIGNIVGVSANAVSVRITRGVTELRAITGYDIEG